MSEAQILRRAIRLLIDAIRATPGGAATLGRLALNHPDLLAVLANADVGEAA